MIPLKRIDRAKTRLRASMDGDHDRLVLAMALDTIEAIHASHLVEQVILVTDDPIAGPAAKRIGAIAVPDAPQAGLNAALRHGAEQAGQRRPGTSVAVLGADLPALRTAELDAALIQASFLGRIFVADTAGTGTTLLAASAGSTLAPAYGPDSAVAHALSGAVGLDGAWPSLRRDVDTAGDLTEAIALGLRRHTDALLCKPLRN